MSWTDESTLRDIDKAPIAVKVEGVDFGGGYGLMLGDEQGRCVCRFGPLSIQGLDTMIENLHEQRAEVTGSVAPRLTEKAVRKLGWTALCRTANELRETLLIFEEEQRRRQGE